MNTLNAKLNSRERKAQRLLAHYATCERLARYLVQVKYLASERYEEVSIADRKIDQSFIEKMSFDGKRISVQLLKAERLSTQRAERMCSDPSYTEIQERLDHLQVMEMVRQALGVLPPGFFVNGDPMGYGIRIDCDNAEGKALIDAVGLQRDLGGDGILSPLIDGSR